MGNVCSSGQKKKKDSISEKSDDTPSYQVANKRDSCIAAENENNEKVAAATEQPEPPSDVPAAQISKVDVEKSNLSTEKDTTATTTPQGTAADQRHMPNSLFILQGKPPPGRKIERDKKIVIYILADNSPEYKKHKKVIYSLYKHFASKCQSHGFDFIISDVHDSDPIAPTAAPVKQDFTKLVEVKRWSRSPLEAQGGHEEAANCLAEISRHLSSAYIIPILFLGSSLGMPMLPLTIESQDFTSVLSAATDEEKMLLEKWYTIDNAYQPMCHRLHTQQIDAYSTEVNDELNNLLCVLLKLFSDDLKDSYMTTVVEQEINNTVLMSQELAKRCIWIQTGAQYARAPENATQLETEVLRRITKIYAELKLHLSEKNLIRLLPTMNVLDEELTAVIESLLEKSIVSIFEEHLNKNSIPFNTNGVDRILLEELHLTGHYSKLLAQNSANFDIMNDLKRYIKDNTQYPLIVTGTSGCGKSVLVSKVMENIHRWKPEAHLMLRYANLAARSSDLTSLVGSIANQMSALVNDCQSKTDHTLESYAQIIRECLESCKFFFVIVIDAMDEILHGESLSWLPINLNNMTKIILTVTENEHGDSRPLLLQKLNECGVPHKCFIRMKQFTERQWNDVLSCGGGDFYAANGALKLPEDWKSLHGKTPFHAKSLWWLAWLGHFSIAIADVSEIFDKMLQVLESKFTTEHMELLLLIVAVSKWGIRESDCLGIFQKHAQLEAPAAFKIWSRFFWLMGPMLVCVKNIKIADKTFRNAILKKYAQKQWLVHKTIREYFDRQESAFKNLQATTKTTYNCQKFLKLPYHHFCPLVADSVDPNKIEMLFNCFYFTDLQWIADKVQANGPVHLMHDILVSEWLTNTTDKQPCIHITFLKDFLQKYMYELNHDGQQFFTLIKYYLKARVKVNNSLKDDEKIRSWLEYTSEIETPFLDILNSNLDEGLNEESTEVNNYDVLVNLPQKGYYVASIGTEKEEISIWDIQKCKRVRILQGIQQPISLCPVGTYEAAVLCRREIKVINLDEGKFKVTLKGVMNQKMPYYGLHDQNHLVCLSRNRMYVNLMNLESGDCVTTFKAGEDRFLNSLLISGDGRILVCGDETQKPFPLLVWHLTQRKLLYDLRIPHHDFVTSLSAITHEGSYVCVVAKELNEPTPNFIVVYDLQSGTLFKKWKPTCNTVSLAISQTNACVIAGLDDAKILIWDLVTGNCRSTLIGHNAPVTSLKLDPLGKVLLSRNIEGRDNSIRVWELNTGISLAVYKPPIQISTCEILPNGAFVVVALKNRTELLTLALKNYGDAPDDNCYSYGNQDNQNKTFKLLN